MTAWSSSGKYKLIFWSSPLIFLQCYWENKPLQYFDPISQKHCKLKFCQEKILESGRPITHLDMYFFRLLTHLKMGNGATRPLFF